MTPLLSQWAARWGVPPQAMDELRAQVTGLDDLSPRVQAGRSESAVQSLVRLEAARKGLHFWRNNVGAVHDREAGTFIRYGLANDSAKVNEELKSADLIGIKPVLIGPEHLGHIIGQFCSREIKREGWRFTGTDREIAQANWAVLVRSLGGDAQFASGEGTL